MATWGVSDSTTVPTGSVASSASKTVGSRGTLVTGGTLTAFRIPVASSASFNDFSVAVYQGGSDSGSTGDPTNAVKIWESGDLQNTALVAQTITAATNGANCQFTITSPNMASGDRLFLRSLTGGTWSTLNNTSVAVTNVSGNTVTTDLDSTSLGSYSSGNCSGIRWYEISASGTLAANTLTWLMMRTGAQVVYWTTTSSGNLTAATGHDTTADANASNDPFSGTDPYPRAWVANTSTTQSLVAAIIYTPAAAGGMVAARGLINMSGGMTGI